MSALSVAPSSDIDLFTDEVLVNPYPTYRRLREAGAAVRLAAHGAWVLPRYQQVRAALADHATFSSAQGVGLDPRLNENTKGTVLASDPPEHDRLRAVLSEKLAPRALASLRVRIAEQADELVGRVVEQGTFDAVTDLAAVFPVAVVADLLGLPEEARDRLLRFADAAFNTFGPMNERTMASLPMVGQMFEYLATVMVPGNLREDGWAAAVYAAADRGEIGRESVIPLLSAYTVAGMDTTISAIGNAILVLAQHPAVFAQVRARPDLLPSAFEESLRLESPVQGFFRVATRDADLDGTVIRAGDHVLLSFGSANRDEQKWERAGEFDARRNPVDHVGFGYGIHGCAGQGLARLEAHALLGALTRRVDGIELAGDPTRRLNNVLRGLSALPVTVSVEGR